MLFWGGGGAQMSLLAQFGAGSQGSDRVDFGEWGVAFDPSSDTTDP